MNELTARAFELRKKTGCGLMDCKDAIKYAENHDGCTPLGYLKAKGIAVITRDMQAAATRAAQFEARVRYFSEMDLE